MRKPPKLLVVPCAAFIASALLMYVWICLEVDVLKVEMELCQRDLACSMRTSDDAEHKRRQAEVDRQREEQMADLKLREEKLYRFYGSILWFSLISAALAYCSVANKKSLGAVGLVLCLVFAILGGIGVF